jgi:hypothetical protein
MLQVNSEACCVALCKYSFIFEELGGIPIFCSNERDILCLYALEGLVSFQWESLEQEKGEAFKQNLGLVENLMKIDFFEYGDPMNDRLGSFFDDLYNLCIIKPFKEQNLLKEEMVTNFIEHMEGRKENGRQCKSNVKDPSFLKNLDKLNIFYMEPCCWQAVEEDSSL